MTMDDTRTVPGMELNKYLQSNDLLLARLSEGAGQQKVSLRFSDEEQVTFSWTQSRDVARRVLQPTRRASRCAAAAVAAASTR